MGRTKEYYDMLTSRKLCKKERTELVEEVLSLHKPGQEALDFAVILAFIKVNQDCLHCLNTGEN